jgi:hypothetical protein
MTPANLFPSEPETLAYPGEPPIWLQRVVILPSRRTGVEEIRNIEFRRGLNVINTKVTQNVESDAFGHNVGKTLLVRMIRYALGDEHYAGTRVRGRVKEKLPEASILAQVRVNGMTWVISRSLARPRDSFCLPTDNWQDLLADSTGLRPFAEFEAALARLLPAEFARVRVARGRRQPTWTDLLGWLIRDQHCRYTSHNTWRFQEDDSDPDVLLDSEANLIIRVLMHLFDRKEYEYTDELDQLRAQLRQHQTELLQIRQDRERTARTISEGAGIAEDLTDGDLAQAAIRARIEEQRQSHETTLERLPEAKVLEDAERELVARRSERDKVEGRIEQLRKDLKLASERLALAKKPDETEALSRLRKAASCGHNECLFLTSTSLPPDPNRQDRIQDRQAEIDRLNDEITFSTGEFDQKDAAVREADQATQAAKQGLRRAAAGPRQDVARCELLLRQFEAFVRSMPRRNEVETQRQAAENRIKELEQLREARATSRKKQMTRLNEVFREVTIGLIRRATGKLSLDLRSGLVPNPDSSSGEAFGSAGQVVGFDLTCLSAAINGNASHPRLLVHDSPREADLNELIYRNLFRYVLSLEARFPDREPAFQYIVTTTSPPPDIVTAKHIRETLHDETASGRLLGFEF